MSRIGWIAAAVWAGCGGAAVDVPTAEPPVAPVAVRVNDDASLRAAGQVLVDALAAALAPCQALLGPVDPAAAEAAPLPFDPEGLMRACGPARDLYDAQVGALSGRARPIDVLLNHVARLGDDIDYVHRSVGSSGSERRRSLEHLHEALARAGEAVAGWKDAEVFPYRCDYAAPSQWALDLQNDRQDAPNLRNHLDRYAFRQGLDPEQVRRRMLDAFGRMLAPYHQLRVAAVAAAPIPAEEKAAYAAYLAAYGAWLDTYTRLTHDYATGLVTDEAGRAQRITDADVALAAWQAAWDSEQSRRPAPSRP